MIFTPSQNKAIEKQKQDFLILYPQAEFHTFTPRHTWDLYLIADFTFLNQLGTQTEAARSWLIGKRGKVTAR